MSSGGALVPAEMTIQKYTPRDKMEGNHGKVGEAVAATQNRERARELLTLLGASERAYICEK